MPKRVIIIFFLVALFQAAFGQTISEIQQTNEPGDNGTYPSPYEGQEVTISNVTIGAKGFDGSDSNMFAFDLNPGLWNGIYLSNAVSSANLNALVTITGTVSENSGMTEITNAVITQVAPGPYDTASNIVTLEQMQDGAFAEQYESCLVKINNLSYNGNTEGNYWFASDLDNNEVRIGSGFFDSTPGDGDEFGSISGILVYDGTNFVVHPRNNDDLVPSTPGTLAVVSEEEKMGNKLYVHIKSSNIKDYWEINGFAFNFTYNDEFLDYQNYEIGLPGLADTHGQVDENLEEDVYTISYNPGVNFASYETPTLITLIFDIKEYGLANVNFSNFRFFDNAQNTWTIADLSGLNVSFNNTYNDKEAYLSIKNSNNTKNIFNPYHNERLTMKYGFKPGYSTKTIVRIYDLKGRLVYTPVNKVHNGLGEYVWDGRDKNRELVDIGTYICQVEVVVRETGDKYVTDQPIVVAGQLK